MNKILWLIAAAFIVTVTPFVFPKALQSLSSLQVGNFTLAVPATNPAIVVNAPAKAGTLALLSDVAPSLPPGATVVSGNATPGTAINLPGLSNPVCTVTPRYTLTGSTLTVTSVDYVCTQKNN